MGKTLTCCTQFWRWLFVGLNIVFLVIGLGLIAVGIYLLVVDQSFSFITRSLYASPAALLIVAGVITVVITIVGIVGSIGMWYIPLIIYISIMSFVVLLQIIAGILGAVFRNDVTTESEGIVIEAIGEYSVNASGSDVNRFIDGMQNQLDCCGFTETSNWVNTLFFNQSDMRFPESCECDVVDCNECAPTQSETCNASATMLNATLQYIWTSPCESQFNQILEENLAIVIGVGLAFGIFEILGVGVAIGLCVCACLKKKNDKEAYGFDDYVY